MNNFFKQMLSGRSKYLNKKVTLWEQDYNRSLVAAYNNGFKENEAHVKRAVSELKREIKKLYDVELNKIPRTQRKKATNVEIGNRINPLTDQYESITVELDAISMALDLHPRPIKVAMLKELK